MTKINKRLNQKNWIEDCIHNNPVKAIVVVGILVRLVVAVLYQYITWYPDSGDYLYLANRMFDFDLSGYEGQRSPGYPLLILLTGFSDVLLVIMQSFMGICTLVIAYNTMLLLSINKKMSLVTCLFLACYLPIVFFELAVLTETVSLFIISLIFYFYFRAIKRNKWNWGNVLSLSLLCGFFILIKPFYVFLPFVLLFFVLTKKGFRGVIWSKTVLFLCIPLFVFLGWSYLNKVNTNYFVSTTYYGFNLAQNCVSFAEKTTPEYEEIGNIYAKYRDNRISDKEIAMSVWDAHSELEETIGLSFPDLSNKLYDYSIATIKENPLPYLKQVFISWSDFWKTSLYWEPQSFGVSQASDVFLYICYLQRIVLQLIKILFVILIPINIYFAIRKRQVTPSLIISLVVLFTSLLQAFATYGTNSRYSFPFEILIVISELLNYQQYLTYKKKKTA